MIELPGESKSTPASTSMEMYLYEELRITSKLASEIITSLGLNPKGAAAIYYEFHLHFGTVYRISNYQLSRHVGTETDKPHNGSKTTPLAKLIEDTKNYLDNVHFDKKISTEEKLRLGVSLFDKYSNEIYRHRPV